MSLAQTLRPVIPLALGLVIGGAGVSMFRSSLTGADGSPEKRAAELEVRLRKAENKLAAYEDTDKSGRRKSGRTTRDGLADIQARFQDGRPVTPDDVFRVFQPSMRAISPVFERIRVREEKNRIDRMSGELARRYDLAPGQQQALQKWFEAKSEQSARDWTNLVTQEGTSLRDLERAAREVRPDDGLDEFMEQTLSGEKLTRFRTERMAEKAERVQQFADTRTERIDRIVSLDDHQRDEIFGIMARQSRDYDPAMKLEGGAGEIGGGGAADPHQAMLAALRPEQRAQYDQEMAERREKATKELEAIGLSFPEDWDPIDEF